MAPTYGTLVDAETVAGHLDSREWVVVDCRFDLGDPDAGYRQYLQSHIPGARFAHLDEDLAAPPRPDQGRHPLPDPRRLTAWLGSQGITRDSQVVAYDDASGAFAARLWWLMRWLGHDGVAVLDGGLGAWTRGGFPLSSEAPSSEQAHYPEQRPRADLIVDTADLPAALAGGFRLLDARAPERFSGEVEPLDPVAGHVPGAVNQPFQSSLGEGGVFLPVAALRGRLEAALDGDSAESVIAMCGSGVTACHLLLAMEHAGLVGGRLYPGSWSEWIRDPERPVATGLRGGGTE